MHGVTYSCGVGVGVSDSFCINLTNIILSEQWYDALFSIFFIFRELVIDREPRNWSWKCLVAENVLGLENASLLKMFGGGKSCSQECLWVENSLCPKMSLFGIYLVVENTSWRKMFGGPKKLQSLSESEEKHHLGSNPFNYYHLFHIKKYINKRHINTYKPLLLPKSMHISPALSWENFEIYKTKV